MGQHLRMVRGGLGGGQRVDKLLRSRPQKVAGCLVQATKNDHDETDKVDSHQGRPPRTWPELLEAPTRDDPCPPLQDQEREKHTEGQNAGIFKGVDPSAKRWTAPGGAVRHVLTMAHDGRLVRGCELSPPSKLVL